MRWDFLTYPAGDTRAQVFWRRRLAVLGALVLLLIVGAAFVLRAGGASQPSAASADSSTAARDSPPAVVPAAGAAVAGPSPSASRAAPVSVSPSPVPSPSATAGQHDPASTCVPGTVALRATADAGSYAASVQPTLTLEIVDAGTSSCYVDLGTKSTSFIVLSGGKPVWSSSACEPTRVRPVRLSPSSAQKLQLSWDRTANASGCNTDAATPLPAGQYELLAHVGQLAAYGGDLTLS